jgi:uncharacterized membrane protein YeaQ/YmgE (transglycosylase-associated protein family)
MSYDYSLALLVYSLGGRIIWDLFLGLGSADGVNFGSIITATLGAFVLLFVYNKFIRK